MSDIASPILTAGAAGLFRNTMASATASEPVLPAGKIEIIRSFIAHAQTTGSTDIHIPEDKSVPIRCRIGGKLAPAINWRGFTDERGLPSESCPSYLELNAVFFDDSSDPAHARRLSTVFRVDDIQVRLQVLKDSSESKSNRAKILARIQPATPPSLRLTMGDHKAAFDSLLGARGLVVVAGPIGGGKTTFAASLALAWAENPLNPGHIITVEDPVEYRLSPKNGAVTQLEADLAGFGGDDKPSLDRCEGLIRRGDMDGLFIGEVLTSNILKTALKFGSANEPVVTTLHAGSITDALISLLHTASESYGVELARLMVLKNLHSIVYVNLAFNDEGDPVPVVMLYQITDATQRSAVSGDDPIRLLNSIETSLKEEKKSGIIGPRSAYMSALQRGATEISLRKILPEVRE